MQGQQWLPTYRCTALALFWLCGGIDLACVEFVDRKFDCLLGHTIESRTNHCTPWLRVRCATRCSACESIIWPWHDYADTWQFERYCKHRQHTTWKTINFELLNQAEARTKMWTRPLRQIVGYGVRVVLEKNLQLSCAMPDFIYIYMYMIHIHVSECRMLFVFTHCQ